MLNKKTEYKRFVWELSNLLENEKEKIVFLCIGTSKVMGDAVGPMVGSILKQRINLQNGIMIIGDLKNNLNFENINKVIRNINKLSKRNLVIVIDSALDKDECIGRIIIQNRGLMYGAGLKKGKDVIGNISIKAVVGKDFNNRLKNFKALKNVSYSRVKELASIISEGIVETISV